MNTLTDMKREGHEDVVFFTGTEIEQTPAVGLPTLFVVGVQPTEEIQDWLDDLASYSDKSKHIKHIYFGANMSFPKLAVNDGPAWRPWEEMINHFLDQGYWCTLDFDVTCVEGLLESGLTEQRRFIPMISVKLPYIQQLGYNATIKLDDKDFEATNPGVWCHNLQSLTNRNVFTDWDEYKNDQPLS